MSFIDEAKSYAAGLINPTMFKAKIFFPGIVDGIDATNLSEFMIESSPIPSRDIGVIELPLWGGDVLKMAGAPTYSDYSCTIVSDGGMIIYKTFERWFEIMHSTIAGTEALDLAYLATIEITIQNGAKSTIYTKELFNAFPISLGEVSLAKTERDDVARFDITFAYSNMAGDLT